MSNSQENRPELVRRLENLQQATKELIAQSEAVLKDAAEAAAAVNHLAPPPPAGRSKERG